MTIPKQSFKLIEIHINKFYEEAIPHHKNLFETHKLTAHKLSTSGNVTQLSKEVKAKKRVVKQLKDLLYELDTLRTQVDDVDLDKFDDKTFSFRKTVTTFIKDYNAIEKQSVILSDAENNINENIENENPSSNISQIQLQTSLSELKLQEQQSRLNNVVNLENDIEDLHGIYVNLNEMVVEQGETIDQIETNVEETQENVNNGLQHLVTASRLKKASYPLTGALLGSLVGGPIGFVAGFKIASAAALSCGVMGYAGGQFLKNCNESEVVDNTTNELKVETQDDTESCETATASMNGSDKKDK